MQEKIKEILREISHRYGVRILFAVESGSRAWGFPSTDSDYDVRFVYAHPVDWYLRLEEGRDVIEHVSDRDLLDLNGWELRKAFRLLVKGNAAIYEWLQSPVIYYADDEFMRHMLAFAPDYFPLKAGLHHYRGVVNGVLQDFSGKQLKVKRLFYALRAALAACWIVDKQTLPPMAFDALKDPLEADPQLAMSVQRLRSEKTGKTESFAVEPPAALMQFIGDSIKRAELHFDSLPDPQGDRRKLDSYFAALVTGRGEQ
jgi:uncharacterized protein